MSVLQDNFLAEAFKIRNLISEFTPEEAKKTKKGSRLPSSTAPMVRAVGFHASCGVFD